MFDRFRYPTGARPLLIDETARRRRIETQFVPRLEAAGYAEVIVPIIDFAEPYGAITAREAARRSYRFVDRDGELVAIRSDFTPMVARALAPALASAPLPLRVFYRGDVIRCEPTRLGTERELFQIGAELIGGSGAAADIEVLRLVADLAASFGASPLISYTDASIAARFDDRTRAAIATKQSSAELPPLARKLIAGNATVDDVRVEDPAAADRFDAIGSVLGDDTRFVLTLDDLDSSASYYTGLRFRLYGSDRRTPLAQGGRYDSLYARFGAPTPAAGFTFTIDDLGSGDSLSLRARDEEGQP